MQHAAPPPLPPGWEPRTDPASGSTYFVHPASGRTQWTPPDADPGPPPGPPPLQQQRFAYPSRLGAQTPPQPPAGQYAHLPAQNPQQAQSPPQQQPSTPGYPQPRPPQQHHQHQQRFPQLPPPPPQHQQSYPQQSQQPLLPPPYAAAPPPDDRGAGPSYPGALPPAYPGAPPAVYPGAPPAVYPGAPPPPPQDVARLAHGMSQLAHGMSQLSHGPSYLHAQASVIHTGTDGRGSVLQLEMSADGLKGKDMMSKSDPCCVVEIWENEKWKVVGKTETLKNTHKPHWSTRVKVAYVFEQLQTMRFRVMDVDTGMLRSDDVLGFVCAPLADVIRAGGIAFPLEKHPKKKIAEGSGKGLGTLVVRAHEEGGAVGGLTRVKLKLSASKLDRADGPFSKSDPYFLVEQTVNNGHAARSILCRSEVVMNSLNPTWLPVTFMVNSNGRPPHEVELEIRLMDHDDRSKHDLLGVVRCSLDALIPGAILDVINAAKQKKKGAKYSNSGRVSVDLASVRPFPSYVSYTMGGCRLRFMCAVDYTASNGSPRTPGTLHYTDGVTLSPYGQALEAVGSVITPYLPDDRTLEAFGFGAILAGSSVASFDFPLQLAAGPMGDPRVVGLDGLMEAYKSSVYNVKFHGPTNFSPILSRAMSASMSPAAPSQQHQHYTIALILTDGQCTDMQETINRIVEASHAHPLSIVIVGVGDADFSAMKRLDGDNKRLSGSSGKASRDIVQFVQWKQGMSPIQLASEVLAEIPQSLVEYMVDRDVVPNPPVPFYY